MMSKGPTGEFSCMWTVLVMKGNNCCCFQLFASLDDKAFIPIALRKAKIIHNFGLSECNRVLYNFGLSECNRVLYNFGLSECNRIKKWGLIMKKRIC